MLSPEQRTAALQQLAATVSQAGLRTPLSMTLEVLSPIEAVSCQLALFMRPFTMGSRWEQYAVALADEAGWQELRCLLARQEC